MKGGRAAAMLLAEVGALPGCGRGAENKLLCAVVNTTYSYLVDMLLHVGGFFGLFRF